MGAPRVLRRMGRKGPRNQGDQGDHTNTAYRVNWLGLMGDCRDHGLTQVLCIYDMAERLGVLVGILTAGVGAVLDSCLLVGALSSYWVVSSSLDERVCAWSYCSLLCQVWMLFLGGLLFSGGRWRGCGSAGEKRWCVETGHVENKLWSGHNIQEKNKTRK